MNEVHLIGRLICKSTDELELVTRHLPTHIELTHAEPGCISFEVAPSDEPLIWTVEERFVNTEAFTAHQARTSLSEWGRATAAIERDYAVTGFAKSVTL